MSRGSERQLWKWLSGGILPEGHFSRVESHETSAGIPDVYYRRSRVGSGWIELKVDRSPVRTAKPPFRDGGLRSTQLDWIEQELEHGGKVWIVARLNGVTPQVVWIPGAYRKRFNLASRNELIAISSFTHPIHGCDRQQVRIRISKLL